MRRASKSLIVLAGVVASSWSVCSWAADAAKEVEAAIREHYRAINADDMKTAASHHTTKYTSFFLDGTERSRYATREEQVAAFGGLVNDGFQADWELEDLNVDLHAGDTVGVATFHIDGSVNWPGGEVEEGRWRVTEIWVRQDGGWKEVHAHMSPIESEAAIE